MIIKSGEMPFEVWDKFVNSVVLDGDGIFRGDFMAVISNELLRQGIVWTADSFIIEDESDYTLFILKWS